MADYKTSLQNVFFICNICCFLNLIGFELPILVHHFNIFDDSLTFNNNNYNIKIFHLRKYKPTHKIPQTKPFAEDCSYLGTFD